MHDNAAGQSLVSIYLEFEGVSSPEQCRVAQTSTPGLAIRTGLRLYLEWQASTPNIQGRLSRRLGVQFNNIHGHSVVASDTRPREALLRNATKGTSWDPSPSLRRGIIRRHLWKKLPRCTCLVWCNGIGENELEVRVAKLAFTGIRSGKVLLVVYPNILVLVRVSVLEVSFDWTGLWYY